MKNTQPDFDRLFKVLHRQRTDRPVLFEFIIDASFIQKFSGHDPIPEKGTLEHLAMTADAFKNLGYDYAPVYPWEYNLLNFPKGEQTTGASRSQNEGALIMDQASFENYEWPDPSGGEYDIFHHAHTYIPDGIKLLACSNGGILENATDICGFENLCMMYMLEPDLTHEIFNHIGSRLYEYYKIVSSFDSVGVCVVNDDWGFKTQTMFPHEMMRDFVFPWTKKIIQAIHENGKPVILHSCGNLNDIMDEVIDDLKIDAKHSFEDNILPIEQAYEKWHSRIALAGGIDLNFLCTKSPAEIRQRAINLLRQTSERGGFALGSGNSIASYVPEQNFLAMISAISDFK